eukprot:c54684_g1_i1.p2 GENE.c54684_g1_i1~~c54684_g1_i1.p2  ORF type:complete len:196 (+),score=32.48 c54684_g1_i1:29-589(+)
MVALYTKLTGTSILLSLIAIMVSILCMSSYAWVIVVFANSTYNIGLKKYLQQSGNGKDVTGYLKDLQALSNSVKLDNGGTSVLACGIVAFVFILLAYVFFIIYSCKTEKKRWILGLSALGFLFAGVTLMIGCLLYATQLDLGWAYMAYFFTGPMILMSAILAIYWFCSSDGGEVADVAMPAPVRLE